VVFSYYPLAVLVDHLTESLFVEPEQIANYFMFSGEIIVGLLAFQGIATTFVFGRKGTWSYLDLWLFTWMIFNNVCAISLCLFPIYQLIHLGVERQFWENCFYFGSFVIFLTAMLFLYTQHKITKRKDVDVTVEIEADSKPQVLFQKIYFLIVFLPLILPFAYSLGWVNLEFIIFVVCIAPWLWCAVTFSNFFLLIHNSLRIIE
jgi:hypothetical protein|tara:strand:- start:269 stop:880 length:612 start_codon:yes stop_codon:yes gene_type:complete